MSAASASPQAYEPVWLADAAGKFKFSEAGIGWRALSGLMVTVPAGEIARLAWMRVARDFRLSVTRRSSDEPLHFDGFPREVHHSHSLTHLLALV